MCVPNFLIKYFVRDKKNGRAKRNAQAKIHPIKFFCIPQFLPKVNGRAKPLSDAGFSGSKSITS